MQAVDTNLCVTTKQPFYNRQNLVLFLAQDSWSIVTFFEQILLNLSTQISPESVFRCLS